MDNLETTTPKPRSTPRGRLASTTNKARHGLLAKSVVLDSESPDCFLHLLRAIEARFEPADELESSLVETIAVSRWRQMRLWERERAGLAWEIRRQTPELMGGQPDHVTRAWLAFRALDGASSPLDALNRYESRCDRQFDRNVQHLNKTARSPRSRSGGICF